MANIDYNSLPIEMQYSEVLDQITRFYGSTSDPWNEIVIRSDAANPTRIAEEYLQEAGIKVIRTPSGRNVVYARSTVLDSYNSSPVSTSNSNAQTATMSGNAKRALVNGTATTTTTAGTKTTTFEKGAKTVSTGSKVMTVLSEATWLTAAARAGGWLGLQFSQELYDSGVSWAWSKEDWADFLSNDADSLDRAVLSFLTGIDANGNATEYMDEKALAQMYMMLREMGVYNTANTATATIQTSDVKITDGFELPLKLYSGNTVFEVIGTGNYYRSFYYTGADYVVLLDYYNQNGVRSARAYAVGKSLVTCYYKSSRNGSYGSHAGNSSALATKISGTSYFYNGYVDLTNAAFPNWNDYESTRHTYVNGQYNVQEQIGTIIYDGTITTPTSIDGIENDPQATTYIDPSLINGQDRDTVLQQLKNNYPELFDGSIYQDVPQDDGTDERITYVPVPYIPSSLEPTTGSNHQNNPSVNTETNPGSDLAKLIQSIVDSLTPADVPDTGEGETPPTVTPVGNASSLWKIYNPTQAQIDAFGSWLWSSNFVDQIKKLFNDPMQGIIGVHKVFATPSVGGTATIKVGYLDSEVSSAYVDNQYTTVDCGTAALGEYFGNVFDYAPYTKVSLYLPFIGIVDLDVSDVMRATIRVKYHVDVLTGACLADVIVNRDGVGGVLYQYAGSAIVTYPVSSGTYLGALAGVAAVATGAIATVMTGGIASSALAVAGTATGLSHLHANVGRSGAFNGCAGAMGGKKPYLIVSRPQTAMAGSYRHFTGLPANAHVTLSSCDGYTRVKSVYVKNIHRATEEEKNMIESQLRQGVLV